MTSRAMSYLNNYRSQKFAACSHLLRKTERTVSLKSIANTSQAVFVAGRGGVGSDDPGDLKLFGTARLVIAILLRETVLQPI